MSFFSLLKETIAFMRDMLKGRIGHNSGYEIDPDLDENWSGSLDEDPYRTDDSDEVPEPKIWYSLELLDDFRKTIGRLPPETGGMIACSVDQNYIDTWRFDEKSRNTVASYSYDVEEMEAQYHAWKDKGIETVGFVHSHPSSYRQPSYDDIVTAYALMVFFGNDFFYLPIIISRNDGQFLLYSFVIRKDEVNVHVYLDYVLKAKAEGYSFIPFDPWSEDYLVEDLETYYKHTCGESEIDSDPIPDETPYNPVCINGYNTNYFQRLDGFYPEKVLDKVIVVVGTGGIRTYIENMARNGFRNFILIDGDRIAPSNVATQGVFISEMGRWKTEAIRDRILDINPDAKVVCVKRFLDDSFSDEMFENYLKLFPREKATDYLILGCCDAFSGNERSANLSMKFGIPYIGAAMYRKGLAAEVIFTYPGVTRSCPRCMLESRYNAYENEGYENDVTSAGCPTFATERLNTTIGFISLMILMYREAPDSVYNRMLDGVRNRNFVWIRLSPYLNTSELGIDFFNRVFASPDVRKYTFMDETLWIPQHPNSWKTGEKPCPLCGGIGDLNHLKGRCSDTRKISVNRSNRKPSRKELSDERIRVWK